MALGSAEAGGTVRVSGRPFDHGGMASSSDASSPAIASKDAMRRTTNAVTASSTVPSAKA